MCTTSGAGNTVWDGSAFNCPSTSNRVVLLHSQFNMPGGAQALCNAGEIVGKSLHGDGEFFTSQLNVTASVDLNNTTIRCGSASALEVTGTSLIHIQSG